MATSLWDSFDSVLRKAEQQFYQLKFEPALQSWKEYYRITAKTEYRRIIEEIEKNWDEDAIQSVSSLAQLFRLFSELRNRSVNNQISQYTYRLYLQLYLKIYESRFRPKDVLPHTLDSGVFEYLMNNLEDSVTILQSVVGKNVESVLGRIYLSFAHLARKEQREAITLLTKNMFLAADQLRDDDLLLSQFKMLLGRLYADSGNLDAALWLLVFESWYRNYLIIDEDDRFFRLMQQKESSERILQVKYYAQERYRHFARCLYIAEYSRQYLSIKKGLIQDQEKYMERLDAHLFSRYRRKRKESK
jgi:hypothetical protein